jgi:hypothetical protein
LRHATLAVIILIAMVVVALVVMRTGWNARARRTAEFVPALPVAPDELGTSLLGPVPTVYISTTRAGDWLERITANGLGVRSRAAVEVFESGVRILRTGAPDLFVPSAALRDVTVAPGIAGKVVGGDGIVVLTWVATPDDPRGVDTGLRPRHAADREHLVDAIVPLIRLTPGATSPAHEENS